MGRYLVHMKGQVIISPVFAWDNLQSLPRFYAESCKLKYSFNINALR